MVQSIANLLVAIKADVDDFQKAMATSRTSVQAFGASVRSVGRSVRRTGFVISAAAGVATAGMAGLVQEGRRLTNAYREVDTLLDGTASAQERYGDVVRQVTEEYAVQGGEIATVNSLYQTISASIKDVGDVNQFLATTAKAARVGMTDMETATRSIAGVLNAYSMEGKQAENVGDMLFTTVKRGIVRFEELANAIGPATAIGAQAGVEFDELAASMATLTRNNITANRAATALRSIMQRFMKPLKDMRTAIGNIAIEQGIMTDKGRQLRTEFQKESDELTRLQMELRGVSEEVQGLQGDFDDLSGKMRDNRMEIMEIRLEARKQGRELTNAEKQQIEELEIANEEYRLQQMKLRKEMEKKQETQKEIEGQLKSQQKTVDEANTKWSDYAGVLGTAILEEKGLHEALRLVKQEAERMDKPMSSLIRSRRALQAVGPLLGEGALEDMRAMENSAGTLADEWQNEMVPAFGTTWQRTLNKTRELLQGLGQDIMKQVLPVLKQLNTFLEGVVKAYNNLDPSLKQAVAQFTLLAIAVGAILGPLAIVIGTAITAAGALGATGLAFAVGIAATAVGLLSIAFNDFVSDGQKAQSTVTRLQAALMDIWNEFQRVYQMINTYLVPALQEFGTGVKQWITTAIETFRNLDTETSNLSFSFKQLIIDISNLITQIGKWLQNNDQIIADMIELGAKIANTVLPAVMNLVSSLKEIGKGALQAIKSLFTTFQNNEGTILRFAQIFADIVNVVADFIQKNGQLIGKILVLVGVVVSLTSVLLPVATAIVGIVTAIAGVLAAMQSWISVIFLVANAFGPTVAIVGALKAALAALVAFLGGPLTIAVVAISALIAAWVTDFMGLRTTTLNVINALRTKFNEFLTFMQGVFNTVKTYVNQGIQIFNELKTELIKVANLLIQGKFGQAWGKLKTLVTDAFNSIRNFIVNQALPRIRTALNQLVTQANNEWDKFKQDAIQLVTQAFTDVRNYIVNQAVPQIRQGINTLITQILLEWDTLKTDVVTTVTELFNQVKTYIQTQAKQDLIAAFNVLKTEITNIIDTLFSMATGLGVIILGFFNQFATYVTSGQINTDIYNAFFALGQTIRDIFIEFFNLGGTIWQIINEFFTQAKTYLTSGQFNQDMNTGFTAIGDVVLEVMTAYFKLKGYIWNVILDFFNSLKTYVMSGQFFTDIKSAFTIMLDMVLELITLYFQLSGYIWNIILDFFDSLKTYVMSGQFFSDIQQAFTVLLDMVLQLITDYFELQGKIWQIVSTFFGDLANYVGSGQFFQDLSQAFNALMEMIEAAFQGLVDGLFYGSLIKDFFNDLASYVGSGQGFSTLKGAWDTLASAIEGVWDSLKSALESISESTIGSIEQTFNSLDLSGAVSAIENVIDGAVDAAEKVANIPDVPNVSWNIGGNRGNTGNDDDDDDDDDDGSGSYGGPGGNSSISRDRGSGMSEAPGSGSTNRLRPMAEGGWVTGPTAALVGEGKDDEFVMPLPTVEDLIRRTFRMGSIAMNRGNSSGGDKITVERGAVLFEEGAFKGIDDEDMPDKIGDEIERRLDEILEDIRAHGR